MNENIFKAYDIRGIYPTEIDEEVVEKIGNSLPERIGKNRIIVGFDARNGSKSLSESMVSGLKKVGVREVIEIGLSTTPMLYFLVGKLDAEGGVMITASHNPPEFNGCKVVEKNAIPVSGTEILSLIKKTGE
ncbi:MAG: hypothetical protein COU07_03415 [Candidatus Harrisonbacteria bacterium CG10_big_fil_rev_8_21_14_0_10_40_38]|uniref:Alpha-D-phosphohexomutase alpha/beta/alpha domain-containing protein n=1 Tax=Candidatus Harrisonbacteria bacterium CG10_big_fil_rev_8_21_14_0_10_40_38 TaxID=1974583 RepID=A0A2H0UR98_9BACT|nr:MAG: hypothetical protein COU07_03415 [Candidatus Harrisonbacteria bacterium CG10_big_fil_rev_8_21_14_0_10_40_38]